ncbi:hypothetical protein LN652_01700 [Nocardioides okcheonensis]|nr:hypothetical protein [Nocardioides okcheonensis]UFN44962.1 hypothetical protein LN652_01700 [Nocardioides okcheonensis]
MSTGIRGPVMVAAGCGGTGRELAAYAGPDGLAGLPLVTRSLTLDPRPAATDPRVVEVPGGLLHDVRLPNPGLKHFLATELPWLVRAGVEVVVSIAGSTMGEYADLARRLSRAPGVAGLEVHLGSPDDVAAGVFETREPFHAASVVAAVRREFPTDRPVLAKLRPDVSRVVEGARACHEAGASAVVLGSAVPAALRRPVRRARRSRWPVRSPCGACSRSCGPCPTSRSSPAAACTTWRPRSPTSTPGPSPCRSAPRCSTTPPP